MPKLSCCRYWSSFARARIWLSNFGATLTRDPERCQKCEWFSTFESSSIHGGMAACSSFFRFTSLLIYLIYPYQTENSILHMGYWITCYWHFNSWHCACSSQCSTVLARGQTTRSTQPAWVVTNSPMLPIDWLLSLCNEIYESQKASERNGRVYLFICNVIREWTSRHDSVFTPMTHSATIATLLWIGTDDKSEQKKRNRNSKKDLAINILYCGFLK
jgi:hypothetical protein